MPSNVSNEPDFFGYRNEIRRGHESQFPVVPAAKRFEADESSGRQIVERLEFDVYLAAFQRPRS